MIRLLNIQREKKLIASLVLALAVTGVGFAFFGIAISVIFVPLAVAALMIYRIHVGHLQQKTEEILEASSVHMATVEALATAIDARDQVGSGHVRRTQIYAIGLGTQLGLSEHQMDALRIGALLHDIGKLAVPDHILSKSGVLTPAEKAKTKMHSTVAASILEDIDFQYPVVPTIKYHHENWDGSGYPDGISGEDIPLTSRILSVANAYDTLRCVRPYRAAITRNDARQHLLAEAGKQFDPALVHTFLKHFASFEAQVDALGLSYSVGENATKPAGHDYVQQIKLANKEVFTLYELAREFGSSVRIEETLNLFTSKIREFVPFDTCAIFLVDESVRYADVIHVEGDHSGVLMDRRIRIGEGATGFVLKKREAVKNVNPDLDFSLSQIELVQEYSTMASLPLISAGELIGAVSVYSRDLESYADEHIRVLETISRIAADAIGKSKQHDQAKAHALTDPMTGLPNARSLKIQFEREVARADRGGNSFQLLMLDLDRFKAVNDSFGHKVGDQMLDEVGQVILEQLREYDFLARYGGDEFVALVSDAGPADVLDLCNRIEGAVHDFKLTVDGDITATVGVSLGAAEYHGNGITFDQMIVSADKAMYERKLRRKRERIAAKPIRPAQLLDRPSNEGFIVELDESHVIMSAAIN